jgi:hypothetical protein
MYYDLRYATTVRQDVLRPTLRYYLKRWHVLRPTLRYYHEKHHRVRSSVGRSSPVSVAFFITQLVGQRLPSRKLVPSGGERQLGYLPIRGVVELSL